MLVIYVYTRRERRNDWNQIISVMLDIFEKLQFCPVVVVAVFFFLGFHCIQGWNVIWKHKGYFVISSNGPQLDGEKKGSKNIIQTSNSLSSRHQDFWFIMWKNVLEIQELILLELTWSDIFWGQKMARPDPKKEKRKKIKNQSKVHIWLSLACTVVNPHLVHLMFVVWQKAWHRCVLWVPTTVRFCLCRNKD